MTSVASDYGFDLEVKALDKNHLEIGNLPDFNIENQIDNEASDDCDDYIASGNIRQT